MHILWIVVSLLLIYIYLAELRYARKMVLVDDVVAGNLVQYYPFGDQNVEETILTKGKNGDTYYAVLNENTGVSTWQKQREP